MKAKSFVSSILIVIVAILSGCNTTKQLQTVERVTHDTLYNNKIHYDSIYIDRYRQTDRTHDTVTVKDVNIEYRYKLLRDTVRIVKRDTIPVIKTVEVTKTERYIPRYIKILSCIGIITIILLILWILRKSNIIR